MYRDIHIYIHVTCMCGISCPTSVLLRHVTWHPRFHGYSIADLQVAHPLSQRTHSAGAFVAHLPAVALVEALLTWE